MARYDDAPIEKRSFGMHSHPRGQLSGLSKGLLTTGTDKETWVVSSEHAIWIPPKQAHYGYSQGASDVWSCYISEAYCQYLPQYPCMVKASGLLREAVIRASQWTGTDLDESQLRITQVILDELKAAEINAFDLPMPSSATLIRIARALIDNPGDRKSVEQWAQWAGISVRTLSRKFVIETGYTYTAWRQRARLMRSLEMLASGEAVTNIALDLGYDSVSAFIALFKTTFGVTPSNYNF